MPEQSALSAHEKTTPQEKFTAAQVCAALHKGRGLITAAAADLGCDPDTVRNYAKRYVSVREALVQAREAMTDIAEAALFKQISAGEAWAVCFYLKTQGKGRGYVERQEVTGKDGGPIAQTVSATINLTALSDAELDTLEALRRKMDAPP